MTTKAVFVTKNDHMIPNVYDSSCQQQLRQHLEFLPEIMNHDNLETYRSELQQVEVIFSTWGMLRLTEEEIATYFPRLKAVFYGAGTVQDFARPFLARGVTVVSAWAANAVPVAEYTVAQIILANKGYYGAARLYKQSYSDSRDLSTQYPGNYDTKVGLLGAGMIGRMVIERLKQFRLDVYVFDPFLSEERARELGVTKMELLELFETCDTISNHLANLPETVGILHKAHFDRMKPYATFINTGRGAQVVEDDLIRALQDVPTRTAVLDVTSPEPVQADSMLLQLDNVVLTPHIAGSKGREVARMGQYMLEEYERFAKGEPLRYAVTLDMLKTMA